MERMGQVRLGRSSSCEGEVSEVSRARQRVFMWQPAVKCSLASLHQSGRGPLNEPSPQEAGSTRQRAASEVMIKEALLWALDLKGCIRGFNQGLSV